MIMAGKERDGGEAQGKVVGEEVGDDVTEACPRSLLRFSMHRLKTRSS